jgi:alkylated DNA repair dioxygenase AlkB
MTPPPVDLPADLPMLYEPDFEPAWAQLLALALAEAPWDDRMRARRTASLGRSYDHSGLTYPELPFPAWLAELRLRIAARVGFAPDNCLLNDYPTGDQTMGFHVDNVDDLEPGTGVVIVSLGGPRTLRFRRLAARGEIVELPLAPGSLTHLPDAVHAAWQHGLAAEPGAPRRVSLTFRHLRARTE